MTIYETDVPGVGHKFELELEGEERLVVLIHHDGKRELYRRPGPDQDSEKLFTLTGKRARQLGSILEGAYFQPVELEETTVPLGDAIIEWVDIEGTTPVVGNTLREANLRERTGISVIAIQRGETTIPNPDPTTEISADDILVAIGTREQHQAFADLLTDEEASDES
ncbi:K+/H+ antiporter YhaU, regulatory subunit KhtT [Halanaeroarchaeum sp. HSR-CO]|uniref:cation:proton antiporter regulatory subunit n=1 Tax=Halanaeroarchaeum sp. HSR-CO TaxID=2866382 RepID=UPI00217D1BAB|nr:TrkA C-terminal domain-containing protein [Halanaeroarchaeum sp. HSR-CO]UWG46431.1 K+/H+ antiporter YhaU, regulatory subunit KhtT [Halanaeroarchaeum sp. HSR-CO]